jgi:DNA ligase-1
VAEPLCGPLGIGPATLFELAEQPALDMPSLSLAEVERMLGPAGRARSSPGGRDDTLAQMRALYGRLTLDERHFLASALTGTLRQGSLGGVMLLAIAEVAGQDEAAVRRTMMVVGSITRAAEALLGPDRPAAPASSLVLFQPLAPMLAASAESLEEALALTKDAQIEWKVDGVRAQVHKKGDRVAIYSRQGNDITAGCAALLPSLQSLDADSAVLDGEVFAMGADGVARAFQDSFSALASKGQSGLYDRDRLCIELFDCMHRDGRDLLDEPLEARIQALCAIAPVELCMPSLRTADAGLARGFYENALAKGHEGVMVKDPSSPYRFGGRGRAWLKVKESRTVDLVILAAEWGSGRRRGYLSNLHLGARREDGTFCMVGKTFKGLTDAMLAWQTEKLQEIATERTEHVVIVPPSLVVEIRFNDVQRSPRYPGGVALRFARVVRHRPDKPASETEPLDALIARVAAGATGAGRKPAAARPNDTPAPKKNQLSLFDD